MKIDIRKKPGRLEDISKGDILIFLGREEIVEQVNTLNGSLLTKRIVKNQDKNYPSKQKHVLYTHVKEVSTSLKGHVYEGLKHRTI